MNTTLREALTRQIDQVGPARPDIEALVSLGERRIRRRQVDAVLASAAAVLVVVALAIGGATLIGPSKNSTGPVDKPSPAPSPSHSHSHSHSQRPHGTLHPPKGIKQLTPRQTVQSYNAQMTAAAVSLEDPDVRVSVWSTTCLVCPKPFPDSRFRPEFHALAVTDDAFRTARYIRGPGLAILTSIHSVDRDMFLLSDRSNGVLKLLGTDGALRRVRMVDEPRTPDDERLVIPCGGFDQGWGVGWCVLDPATATAGRIPATFIATGISAGVPVLGQRPWGAESMAAPPRRAWWDDGGVRRYADVPLTDRETFDAVPSLARNEDTPTYLRWRLWSHRLEVFQVEDRSDGLTKVGTRPWLPATHREMGELGHPNEVLELDYARTPDGGLLAWSYREFGQRPGLTIWRAESLTAGDFETVYAGDQLYQGLELTVHDGRIYLGPVVSDDDGRTWAEPVAAWR